MRVVLEALLYFMLADDDGIHPDVANEQVESMSYFLKQMSPVDKAALVGFARNMGLAEREANGSSDRVDSLLNIGEELQLLDID